jgi:hypothetical protein
MTATTRRQTFVLGVVLVVLVGVLWFRFGGDAGGSGDAPAAAGPRPSNPAARSAAASTRDVPVADVRLELLEAEAAPLADEVRNPFRFGARAPQPSPGSSTGAPRAAAPPPPVYEPPPLPVGPPPPPPIPLRFIGVIDERADAPRVAVLSDGRGTVLYGKEGDIIDGRYRVLRISADSADLAYTDGRGRQTIRLSGQ